MRTRRAFTLIEVLIVVVVLGILAAIVAVNYTGTTGEARLALAKDFERQLRNGVAMYSSKTGNVPNSFHAFMSFSSTQSQQSFLCVNGNIRAEFDDPGANVGISSTEIVLPFRGGATATYTIDSDGVVTADYDGFDQ